MRYIFLFMLACSILGCQFDFYFSGYNLNTSRCHGADTCTTGLEFYTITETHDTQYTCYMVARADCHIQGNQCDTLICNDGSYCTEDACDSITGCSYVFFCDDSDACTDDHCEDEYCTYDLLNCSDGDGCTNDFCAGGVCINVTMDCNDEVDCTQDACVPQDGICEHMDTCFYNPCPFDTIQDPVYQEWCKVLVCDSLTGQTYNAQRSCSDGDPCTNDICYSEQCHNFEYNCDDGSDCVNTGMCWCEDGYCVYGSGKRIPVALLPQIPGGFYFYATENPFHISTTIKFRFAEAQRIHLSVHEITGRTIWSWALETDAAEKQIEVEMSGVYIVKLVTESGDVHIRKIVSQW